MPAQAFFPPVLLMATLIIAGLAIDLGGGPDHKLIGFANWARPGAFAHADGDTLADTALGMLAATVLAAYAFQGMEVVAIAAAETENPRRNMRKAVRRVFWRISVFYLLGTFVAGLLVPSDDSELLRGASSSFALP
jgi:yeast amino acid transporter